MSEAIKLLETNFQNISLDDDDFPAQILHPKEGDGTHRVQGHQSIRFADIFLDRGSFRIKAPHPPRTSFQIGDHDMVGIFPVFEESQLLSFYRILRDRTPHDDKAMGSIPLVRFVPELANLPCVAELLEPTLASTVFDGGVLSRNDRIASAALIEKLDDSFAEEAGVATNANARSGDLVWYLARQILKKGIAPVLAPASPGAANHARTPDVELRKQAADDKNGAPDASGYSPIEHPAASRIRPAPPNPNPRSSWYVTADTQQLLAELVVNTYESANLLGAETLEEAPQRGLVGKCR
jgi:hypothetical protein